MATKIKDTLSHADKFKEFGLFRERTTLVFPLFSDCPDLALQRFKTFLTESMGWGDIETNSVMEELDISDQCERVKDGVSIVISTVNMDNNLIIHYDVYRYEDR